MIYYIAVKEKMRDWPVVVKVRDANDTWSARKGAYAAVVNGDCSHPVLDCDVEDFTRVSVHELDVYLPREENWGG